MPMGIVSDNDFLNEFNNSGVERVIPPTKVEHKEIPSPGRKDGDLNVPTVLQKIIGEQSELEGRASALEIARAFSISPSSVSAYSHGATSTATIDKPKDELSLYIKERKGKLTKKALNRLNWAIHRITRDKLADCSAPQLANVAATMASVVKGLDNSDSDDKSKTINNGPTFVIMQPTMKSEDSYGIVHSRE